MGHEGIPFLEPGLSGLTSIASWGALKGAGLCEFSLGVIYLQFGQHTLVRVGWGFGVLFNFLIEA